MYLQVRVSEKSAELVRMFEEKERYTVWNITLYHMVGKGSVELIIIFELNIPKESP